MTNPLAQLAKAGQSVWFDQMERKLVTSGALARMIEDDDLRGLTSNPTIFEKAIGGSEDYDAQIRTLASQGRSRDEIYDEIVLEDIASAADAFLPVYEKTNGDDGYVSLEVSPTLAHDTEGTVAEAKRLFGRLGRPNVMIKIPATPEGIPAIEETIAAGINVNVTLIFSNEVYSQVIEAYLRGLERRAAEGLPVGNIASVASFFISRIDTQADKQLEAKAKQDPSLESLLGKVAIANAKLAYQLFLREFGSDRFIRLRDQGARVQRPLWASTGTKNARYSDVLYVETLIGPNTVNTLPPATYEAFRDHGKVELTIEEDVDDARRTLDTFEAKGFRLEEITNKLTADGVRSFAESFEELMLTIEARRDLVTRKLGERVVLHGIESGAPPVSKTSDPKASALGEAISRIERENLVHRIFRRDASVWKTEADERKGIENALGWIRVPDEMTRRVGEIVAFADEVRTSFSHVVVLGMGGSSLASEVTRRAFGRREGYPELLVLDSTVPEAVSMLEAHVDLTKTLFIVASKSGTTTEPVMFHRYFYDRVRAQLGDGAGASFIAITDPGMKLEEEARRDGFRRIFLNMPDIGGRYSALSYFGLVPMALSGVDVKEVLDRALHAMHVSSLPQVRRNPAALLGAVMGSMALQGRDKVTLVTPRPLDTLGLWIEQLVAESTGKEGKGIVPIAGEPELGPGQYGDDRLFVAVRMRGSDETGRLRELAGAGHPVVDIILEDELDLGEIFYLWEFATAVAGAVIGVNPFDQPNVQESKDNTKRLLEQHLSGERMGTGGPAVQRVSANDSAAIAGILAQVKKTDYVALTQFFAETRGRNERLTAIRETLSRHLGVPATSGYGPRFLHSTGQLHKGGPDNAVFLQLTGGGGSDVEIPGESFSFGVLARAQAIGDLQSLASRNRRCLSIDLGENVEAGLDQLEAAIQSSFART